MIDKIKHIFTEGFYSFTFFKTRKKREAAYAKKTNINIVIFIPIWKC